MIEVRIGEHLFVFRRRHCALESARALAGDLIPVKWNAQKGWYEEVEGVEIAVRPVEGMLYCRWGKEAEK